MPRKSRGRQKIEMTRMSKESNLLVTFSKRRSGLFKKASELCTLCAAEIAVLVFSPAGKVFSFGHPSVDSVINRFISIRGQGPMMSTTPSPVPSAAAEAHRGAGLRELNGQLTEALARLETERKRGEELGRIRKAAQENCWWEGPINGLGPQQLDQLKEVMEDLKKNVAQQADKVRAQAAIVGPFFHDPTSAGPGGGPIDLKVSGLGLGLSMTPHGYALGYAAAGPHHGFI
ncbi:agamous-like MADS-box protein AGL62 [Impatiens glandulifera]|uniref:agamous-like MADS-box protein AGL62 n=1 Tax=Impatiens glandulifera TaxID=253017 RepID=UPI001FB17066|nr:agamous-like MADS-box protein AGL62 [Impatiens glandulifera]